MQIIYISLDLNKQVFIFYESLIVVRKILETKFSKIEVLNVTNLLRESISVNKFHYIT